MQRQVMKKALIRALWVLTVFGSAASFAQNFSAVVVFSEAGFPAADSVSPSSSQLGSWLPGAQMASAEGMHTLLAAPATHLLVLPYGSAFPEQGWPDIQQFLQRGGNLLVLGGQPFTRSAYREAGRWHLRNYSVRFTRPLMIDQYQLTPGSQGLEFQANPDVPMTLPQFAWKRGFSPVIRLSAVDLYQRGGAAGSIDARVDPLAWGVKDGRKLAAPAIEIDHLRNGFDGGRWIFVNAELAPDFYEGTVAPKVVRALVMRALAGSEEFIVRPVLPL
jgi:hypothetical protein